MLLTMTFSSAAHPTYCCVSIATVVMRMLCYLYIAYLVFNSLLGQKAGWMNRDLAYFLNQLVYSLFNHYHKLNKHFVFWDIFLWKSRCFWYFHLCLCCLVYCCPKGLYAQPMFYAHTMFLKKKMGIYQNNTGNVHIM